MNTQILIRNVDDMKTITSAIELLSQQDGFDIQDLFLSITQYANRIGKNIHLHDDGVRLVDYVDLDSSKTKKSKRDNEIVQMFEAVRKASPAESTTRISLVIGQQYGLSDRAVQKILRAKNVWTSRNSK